jgi:RibD C-terminal domain
LRQLIPVLSDPIDLDALYGDLPDPGPRPAVRLNMIASLDGATTVTGVLGGLGGPADHALFAVLRAQADVVLVAAGTVRAEHYGPAGLPIAVISRSCQLDWDTPFFTAAADTEPVRMRSPGRLIERVSLGLPGLHRRRAVRLFRRAGRSPVPSVRWAGREARAAADGAAPVCCGVALALDVGQAFGELAISDPDNIHAAHVPVRPVVAPAHDGAS